MTKSTADQFEGAALERHVTAKMLIAAGAIFLIDSTAFIVLNNLAEHHAAQALVNNNISVHLANQAESDGYTSAT
jgi:hypothetical protein